MTRLDLLGIAGLLALASGLSIGQPWPGVVVALGAVAAELARGWLEYLVGEQRAADVEALQRKVLEQQEVLERLNKSVDALNRAAAFGGKP